MQGKMRVSSLLSLLTIQFLSYPILVSSYVTSGLPGPTHRAWLKEMTSEVCETAPGELTQEMCTKTPQLLSAWARNPYVRQNRHSNNPGQSKKKNSGFEIFPHHGKECAMFCERLLKRLVDERRAGNPNAIASTQSYNCLIDVWSRSGERGVAAQRAEEIVVGMQDAYAAGEKDVQPDAESFRLVLRAWSQAAGKGEEEYAPHRAQRLLEWMVNLYESGQNDLLRPDAECFDIVLSAWVKSNHPDAPRKSEEIIMFIDRLYTSGNEVVKPTRIHFNKVLTAWSKSNLHGQAAPRRAEDILNHMIARSNQDLDLTPNIATYTAVAAAWAKSGNDDCGRKAEGILKQLEQRYRVHNDVYCTPDTIIYNIVIDSHSKTPSKKSHLRARAVLDRQINMVKKGNKKCKPDVYSFTSVLASCASLNGAATEKEKSQAFDIAKSTFLEMCRSNVTPNHVTYGTMLKACGRLLPMGKERRRYTREYFRKACQFGCVGDMVLNRLEEAASPAQLKGLLNGHSKESLPEGWTSAVPSYEKNSTRRKKNI